MHAQAPSFDKAINQLDQLMAEMATTGLAASDMETLKEARRRLERLAVDAGHLVALNNELVDAEGIKVHFDPDSDTITYKFGDSTMAVRLQRKDPAVPLQVNLLTSGGGYDAGQPQENAHVRRQLETGLEAYYDSAHRVLKLLATIQGLRGLWCREVTIVRNKLIEHPVAGSIYSFGFGDTGPRVKPATRGPAAWNDEGLVPNTRAFVEVIAQAIERKLSVA
jgi:hypothetical protein